MSVQTAALWNDPDPVTPAGRALWDRFINEGCFGAALLYSELRDIGQRICQTEQEAAALALGRVEAAVRALPFAFDSGRRRAVLAAIEEARGAS